MYSPILFADSNLMHDKTQLNFVTGYTMSFCKTHLLPKILNLVMKTLDLPRMRAKLIPLPKVLLLEVGIHSGLNLSFYYKNVKVTGVDLPL